MLKSESKWHHQITHFPELSFECRISKYKKIDNFCSYTRWFLWKLLVVIPMVVLFSGCFLGWYLSSLAAFVFLDLPSIISGGGAYGAWLALNLIIALFIMFVGICWLKLLRDEKQIEKEELLEEKYLDGTLERPMKIDNFLTTWYKAFKGKYCPQMEY